jgi:hypothetical protein
LDHHYFFFNVINILLSGGIMLCGVVQRAMN